jgi:hypothetical protein
MADQEAIVTGILLATEERFWFCLTLAVKFRRGVVAAYVDKVRLPFSPSN